MQFLVVVEQGGQNSRFGHAPQLYWSLRRRIILTVSPVGPAATAMTLIGARERRETSTLLAVPKAINSDVVGSLAAGEFTTTSETCANEASSEELAAINGSLETAKLTLALRSLTVSRLLTSTFCLAALKTRRVEPVGCRIRPSHLSEFQLYHREVQNTKSRTSLEDPLLRLRIISCVTQHAVRQILCGLGAHSICLSYGL